MRALAVAAMLIVLGVAPAYATGGDKPDCHGNNEEKCREDPNESGQDCDAHGNNPDGNDDHCATTTTSVPVTVVTDPTTTTSTVAATTTTAAPTTTTTVPAAQVTPAPATDVHGVTELREVPPEQLPHTGTGASRLAALGLFAGLLGLVCAAVAKPKGA